MKTLLRPLIPLTLIAAAVGFVATQPHHRRCRLEPTYAPAGQPKLEYVATNLSLEGFRLISPSVNCGRCHDPKAHTVIP